MKKFIREYFTFNNREKRGLIFLMSVIATLVLAQVILPYVVKPKTENDYSQFEKEIDAALASNVAEDVNLLEPECRNEEPSLATSSPETKNPPTQNYLFTFNPNKLSKEKWQQLGLSDKQINTIINFESKGGRFYKNDDLKKIYGITEADYNRLEPYIHIPNPKLETLNSKPKTTVIELNSADSLSLLSLKGIGPAFASRILKYRNLLGGFYSKQQLMEVYGFTNDMLSGIENQISIETSNIKKININTSDINQLKKHPYIKYNNAKLLVNYRNANGNFKHIEEIKKIHLINDSIFNKIYKYLVI